MKLLTITMAAFVALIFAGSVQAQESTKAEDSAAATIQKEDTQIDGVTAEVTSAARTDGDTVTIKYKFTNTGQKEIELDLTGYSPDNLSAKVYYIDSKNKKKYLVVTDAADTPICSMLKGSTKLAPGESKSGWAKLPAPPANVATISIYLPGTPPFEGVSISAK